MSVLLHRRVLLTLAYNALVATPSRGALHRPHAFLDTRGLEIYRRGASERFYSTLMEFIGLGLLPDCIKKGKNYKRTHRVF